MACGVTNQIALLAVNTLTMCVVHEINSDELYDCQMSTMQRRSVARSNTNLDVTQTASASIDYSSLKSGQKKALEPQS